MVLKIRLLIRLRMWITRLQKQFAEDWDFVKELGTIYTMDDKFHVVFRKDGTHYYVDDHGNIIGPYHDFKREEDV